MSDQAPSLQALRELSVLGDLDLHFARAMARLGAERDERVSLAAAMVSQKVQAGHVCLDLPRLCQSALVVEAEHGPIELTWPALEGWLTALRASALCGDEHALTPLYLDADGRLYLRRYFEHERNLARAILERARRAPLPVSPAVLQSGLDRLFGRERRARSKAARRAQLDLFSTPDTEPQGLDLQRLAAARAVELAFSVISGGPGTGKTSTVVKILALLVEQALGNGEPAPRVQLLAPTGKAAARLSEAIKRAKRELDCSPEVRSAIAEDASTIHRALRASGGNRHGFGHNHESPLAADVVIVDEASMVDLALMARLLDAVPSKARLILLGDKNQLASVEAGAVLGDICGAGLVGLSTAAIASSIVHLTHSYRYAPKSGIRQLADAINDAQPARVLAILRDPALSDVALVETTEGSPVPAALFAAAARAFVPFFEAPDGARKLHALERFRVLCAHRRGPYGQLAIDAGIEAELRRTGFITSSSERYDGRPIIVTQNDYQARLFNGDVGVLLRDPLSPERLRAVFAGSDGRVREISAARLPPHEGVYAMSVHKSQGSELDEVAVVLPSVPSPVLSRELLYTAVTRVRHGVAICGRAEVLAAGASAPLVRSSGLAERLG